VFAALAVSRWIEHVTGWSIRKFVKTARRYRTVQIQAGTRPHRCPANSARPSKPSTPAADLRTSLAEVRLLLLVTFSDHRCRTIRSSESVIERACGLVSLRAF
jgi:hypothetical protein